MDLITIKALLKEKEGQTLEFKNYQKKLGSDIFKTVCAFANRDGGNIIIGIDDKTGKVVGVPPEKVEQMKKEFTNGVANPQKNYPRLTYELNEIIVDGKILLYTTIFASAEVHKLDKINIYDRLNESDINITDTQDLISSMLLKKKEIYSENKIFPYTTMNDLDINVIEKARKYALIKNKGHLWGTLSNEEMLVSAGLYLTNHSTGEKGYTLACILLFGKDKTIMSVCPQHRTDLIKRIENMDRYDDREDVRTNLIDTYFKMMDFIKKHLDAKFSIDESGIRYSPRDLLFREAIVNSIIHREYRERTVAKMIIEKDKVIFENGCIPYRQGRVTLTNFQPKSKNPRIAYVFNNMGLADELGSGIRNMYKFSKIYSGNTPNFTEGEIFKAIIPLMSNEKILELNISNKNKIVEYIKQNKLITTSSAIKLTGLGKTRTVELFNELLEENIILRKGSGPKTHYILKDNI